MEWNEESIARLRTLWAEGLSTAEIGRRMNVSKNAVVGKAHRLNLPARPSPIRRDASGAAPRPPVPRRVTGPTLPPLSAPAAPMPAVAQAAAPAPRPPAEGRAEAPPRAAAVRPAPYRPTRLSTCCWPIGEPGTKSFRFCDADSMAGKPYCTEHAALAYVKVRDRRDEAAA
jgi:GcrA cell cycle regulator